MDACGSSILDPTLVRRLWEVVVKQIDRLRRRLADARAAVQEDLERTDNVVRDWQPRVGDVLDREVSECGLAFYLLKDGWTVVWRVDGSMAPFMGPAEGREGSGMSESDWRDYQVAQCEGAPMTVAEAAAANPPRMLLELSRDEVKWFWRLSGAERAGCSFMSGVEGGNALESVGREAVP